MLTAPLHIIWVTVTDTSVQTAGPRVVIKATFSAPHPVIELQPPDSNYHFTYGMIQVDGSDGDKILLHLMLIP